MQTDDLDALIKRAKAYKRLDVSRTTGWRLERDDPSFPRAIKIGPNSWAFRVADVQRWIDSRPGREKAAA